MKRDLEDGFRVDDVADDAASAWREVMARTPNENPEPDTPEPEAAPEPAVVAGEKPGEGDKPSNRDEMGRFAKVEKIDEKPAANGHDKTKAPEVKTEEPAKAAAAPAAGPPPSWSVKSKAAWEKLPAEVKADIAKREQEMAQGLAALRDYKDLKPYAELASRHGTTLPKALDHYIGIENKLKADLPGGLMQIAQNFGLNQQQGAALFLDMARRLGAQVGPAATQAQTPTEDDDPIAEILNPLLKPLTEKVSALESQFTARLQADRNAAMQPIEQALTRFTADPANKFVQELFPYMVRLIETGMVEKTGNPDADLKAAYDMAARMHPEIHEALIEQRLEEKRAAERQREQEAAAKAKAASRSISGSRAPGLVITDTSETEGFDDIEADVRRAYRAVARA